VFEWKKEVDLNDSLRYNGRVSLLLKVALSFTASILERIFWAQTLNKMDLALPLRRGIAGVNFRDL
jgi:hypothetical protein